MLRFLRKPLLAIRRQSRRLWMRVTGYALLAVLTSAAGPVIGPYLPDKVIHMIEPDSVIPILSILASSMLAVSTFSLNVMVSAQNTAADRTTPRIHRLMLQDQTTQSVLAVFIGAFIYSLTSIILFRAGLHPKEMAVLVMVVTILVIILVVISLLRWINHLSDLGSLENSLQVAMDHARVSLLRHARAPGLGAVPLTGETVLPETVTPVPAIQSGYVQVIDISGIAECLTGASHAYVTRAPGQHVLKGQPMAVISGEVSAEALTRIGHCFVTGPNRTNEQDPEFGIIALSETAARALSPGINDSGTAIEAIERMETLIWEYAGAIAERAPPRVSRVFVPSLSAERLFQSAFGPAARDGAGTIEVMVALRQSLLALTRSPDEETSSAASSMAEQAMQYAEKALTLEIEKERLRAVVMPPIKQL